MQDPETTFIRISLLDWEQLKGELAQLRERMARLELGSGLTPLPVDPHRFLDKDSDLTVYEVQPGDKGIKADISMADVKEMLMAINVSNRRIHALVSDLEAAQQKIASLEHHLQAK